MLNVTVWQSIATDFELMSFAFLYILAWTGVTTVLVIAAVLAIRFIGEATGLPVGKIFKIAGALLDQKITDIKNQNDKQKPFFFSMLGITIMADGVTGKIIFIALLSTIATATGSLVVIGLEDFNPIPDNWY